MSHNRILFGDSCTERGGNLSPKLGILQYTQSEVPQMTRNSASIKHKIYSLVFLRGKTRVIHQYFTTRPRET